jgi:predicted nucleic-acid-binding Zn-ribbon protein
MDDKQSTTKTLHRSGSPITLDQFNAFLAARAPEKPCTECGARKWGIPGEDGAVFKGSMANGVSLQAREFNPINCRHCGIARLYAAEVIESWAEENRHG